MEYEAIIGLEVHVELATQTKAFCGCANKFGEPPNTLVCPVCLGFPGSLPVLNKKALEYAVRLALALHCEVKEHFKFDRKNYYYPDLPKNYQISQYDLPLSLNGYLDLDLNAQSKKIRIRRVHLEEDAAKLIHKEDYSLVDYNRSGIPLLEIVSEPDINSAQEAYVYLTELKAILEYLGVSQCDMEKGFLRCDANVSLRGKGESKLGTKTELKNMNSFKAVKDALEYEINRQGEILERKERIVQETRLWDADKGISLSMRSKEEAHDYRYFPEPDLVPFVLEKTELETIKKNLPELPRTRARRFREQYLLSDYDAGVLTSSRSLADYFEECVGLYPQAKTVSNWITTEIFSYLNEKKILPEEISLKPEGLIRLLELFGSGTISRNSAKEVLRIMLEQGRDPDTIIKEKNLTQISDGSVLDKIAQEVIQKNAASVTDYLKGKENALMFLVGQVMRQTQGKANPQKITEILRDKLRKVK
jgi:aspartyl-tRNA(Asn)/glutamyl-tRNA(Gln) amidotransferase subunit B